MSLKAAVRPGRSIGKYEVVKHLATGGMAEIYLARVTTLPGQQKLVVLKRMLPELAAREDYVEMFLDEARIATLLDHPNIVHTFDAGVVDGNPFLAMEYVHGEPVNALMSALSKRGERLSAEHAVAIVAGVCSGLHYAHEKVGLDGHALNIVHRDVTPQNVIVTYDGGVKLVDFGIAKSAQRAGRTRYGTIKGKAPYMSPEQCLGEPLDRRSDLFSVGIMLYELTLNRRLFVGKGDYEVLKQIVEGRVVPPHELDAGYDPALEAVVLRALEKSPDRRQQSAREMQGELEAAARAAQLHISSLPLAQLMERCFGNKIQVLRDAEAQGNVELLSLVVDQGIVSEDFDELPPSVSAVSVDQPTDPLALAPPPEVPVDESAVTIDDRTRFARRIAAAARPERRRRAGWVLAAALLAAGGAGAVALTLGRHPQEQPPVRQAEPSPPPVRQAEPSPPPAAPIAAPPATAPPPRETIAPAKTHAAPRPGVHPQPPAVEEGGSGKLVLASSPWCRVAIDGIDRGPTPLRIDLPAGSHVVDLSNPDYRISRRITVSIRPNETVRKSLDFGD